MNKMKVGEKATFRIELTDKICKQNHYDSNIATATVEVQESGAFAYGNRTATVMVITAPDGSTQRHVYDTRYVVEPFDKFAWDLVADYLGENLDCMERTDTVKTYRFRAFMYRTQVKQKTIHANTEENAYAKWIEYARKKGIEYNELTFAEIRK